MKSLYGAITWVFNFVHGVRATPANYASRKIEYMLTKHAIRKVLKDYGFTYAEIGIAEGEYTGTVTDHSTVLHSCSYAQIPDSLLDDVSNLVHHYFHGEPKNKVIDSLITFILSKGAGSNRDRMIELIDKYYTIERKRK